MAGSLCRQNFHSDCETGINRQINMQLHACYCYQSMAFYFDREDVALRGFASFFHKLSWKQRQHAEKLMEFQNKRGGRILLQDVKKPEHDEWGSGLDAMQVAQALEKSLNQALIDLNKLAEEQGDLQMSDFLEDEFLQDQVQIIKLLGDYISSIKQTGGGLGEYLFDQKTLGGQHGCQSFSTEQARTAVRESE